MQCLAADRLETCSALPTFLVLCGLPGTSVRWHQCWCRLLPVPLSGGVTAHCFYCSSYTGVSCCLLLFRQLHHDRHVMSEQQQHSIYPLECRKHMFLLFFNCKQRNRSNPCQTPTISLLVIPDSWYMEQETFLSPNGSISNLTGSYFVYPVSDEFPCFCLFI